MMFNKGEKKQKPRLERLIAVFRVIYAPQKAGAMKMMFNFVKKRVLPVYSHSRAFKRAFSSLAMLFETKRSSSSPSRVKAMPS